MELVLIGRMRLNDNFDLRIEPGLQFVERELTFNTQTNDQYVEMLVILTDADKDKEK